jgi:hypothetical protein
LFCLRISFSENRRSPIGSSPGQTFSGTIRARFGQRPPAAIHCQQLRRRPRDRNPATSYAAVASSQDKADKKAGGLFVLGERAGKTVQNKTVLTRPRCVGCAQPMRLIRKTLRFGRLPDLYTFECQTCGETHIEEAMPPELADE